MSVYAGLVSIVCPDFLFGMPPTCGDACDGPLNSQREPNSTTYVTGSALTWGFWAAACAAACTFAMPSPAKT